MVVIISGDNRGPLATGPLFAVLPVAGIIFAGRGRVLVCCGQCNTIQHKYSNVNTHSHTASASRHTADVTVTEKPNCSVRATASVDICLSNLHVSTIFASFSIS